MRTHSVSLVFLPSSFHIHQRKANLFHSPTFPYPHHVYVEGTPRYHNISSVYISVSEHRELLFFSKTTIMQ